MALYTYNGTTITIPADLSSRVSELEVRNYYCSFSLFETIGVVGDSYANGNYGETANADTDGTGDVGHRAISWPQMLGRRNGVTVTNYAVGGQSTRSFLTNTANGLPALLADTPKELYLLALERNDFNYGKTHDTYLGSLADITGNSLGSYPDTFYGNYATIIENILTHAPGARLVMMVGDYTSSYPLGVQFNAAMVEIAQHYGIPYMEQLTDSYFLGSNAYYREKSAGGHPTPYAYCGMALAIERLFNKCVRDNKAYFMYYTGVTSTT